MKFTVKDLDIATAGPLVVVLHKKDAQLLDLHAGDRVLVKAQRKKSVVIVDISESSRHLKSGELGCFEEVLNKLNLKHSDTVELASARKPYSIDLIKCKLQGCTLSESQMDTIVKDIVNDELTEGELTYFVSGCYTNGLHLKETVALTKAIVKHGRQLSIPKGHIIDKHCVGGVPGNRTTLLVVPIIAAAGYMLPKTSSRSITSPAGTADTMEVLCNVTLPVEEITRIVKKINACIAWGGGVNLAAADDKLIRVRHPLSIDPEGMLLASILAKKKAVGASHVIIDIPVGKHTKIRTKKQAEHLKSEFYRVGKMIGIKVHVVITKGEEPIGNGIGPALEARDVLWVLRRDPRGPKDLERKSIMLAGDLFHVAGVKNGREMAREILESGKAYAKMQEIIYEQGGDPDVDPEDIKIGEMEFTVNAAKSGVIEEINTSTISHIARMAGAPLDPEAGLFLHVHLGDKVKKGDPLFTIYAKTKDNLHFAKRAFYEDTAITIR